MKQKKILPLFFLVVTLFTLTTIYSIRVYAETTTYSFLNTRYKNNNHTSLDINTSISTTGMTEMNCRYGTAGFNAHMLSWLPTFGTGWYVNFSSTTPISNGDSEFVPIIRVRQEKINGVYQDDYYTIPALTDAALGTQIAANPGALWLVGNEPDVAAVQDDTYPGVYARAYHDVYSFIKQRDPSAQVGIGGLSMATPGRLQYLDIVWNTYLDLYGTPMPVDVWNIHVYILSEYNPGIGPGDGKLALGTDPALAKNWPVVGPPYSQQCPQDNIYCRAEHDDATIFAEQLTQLRIWMKEHGQREKPLILSEYGQLYPYIVENGGCFLSDEFGNCFTPTRVNNYMNATLNWLETTTDPTLGYSADNNRLVQQWLWFSLRVGNEPGNEESGGSSNLLIKDYTNKPPGDITALTQVGQNYLNHIQAQTLYKNLVASNALPSIAFTTPPTNTASATLTIEFHNNGNTQINQPFNVTFYSDAGLTQEIGTVPVNPTLQGCARQTYTASIDWTGLTPGLHPYWVKVDSDNTISETNGGSESDNNAAGIVLVDPESVYLPIITRSVP